MLTGLEGLDRRLGMQVRGIANVHQVDVLVTQQVSEARVFLDAGEVHHLARRPEIPPDAAPVACELPGIAAANRLDARPLELAGAQVSDHAHEANADGPGPHHYGRTRGGGACS